MLERDILPDNISTNVRVSDFADLAKKMAQLL
jgi:hypothetical protein